MKICTTGPLRRNQAYDSKKPFFFHIMTTSNHRPFTYPEGKIDILPVDGKMESGRAGAVKYTDYALSRLIKSAEKLNNKIILKISNTGHPIPEEDLDRVFEQFYRVEKSRSLTHGGSGLGLAIVKKIVELHDGVIQISNEPDQLITITVSFQYSCLTASV